MITVLEPRQGGRVKFDGKEYEITYAAQGTVRLTGLFGSTRKLLNTAEYLQLQQDERIVPLPLVPDGRVEAVAIKPATESQLKKFLRQTHYVTAAFYSLNGRSSVKSTERLISQAAKEIGDTAPPKYSTLREWLAEYLRSGCDPLCFHPSRKVRKQRQAKRSPDRQKLRDLSEGLLRDAIYNDFLTQDKNTLTACYRKYAGAIEELNQTRTEHQKVPLLSYQTLTRRVDEVDATHAATAIHGPRFARKLLRASAAIRQALYAAHTVEIDSQSMDILVVDERGEILGRPTLIVIICTTTGVLVGYDLSLSPPCSGTARRAIRHAVSDASGREFSAKFSVLRMDRGTEYNNAHTIAFLNNLGVRIIQCEPQQPNQKPFVEAFFRNFNLNFMHQFRGTTKSNPIALGDQNPSKRACWRLDEVRQEFDRWEKNIFPCLASLNCYDRTPMMRWNEFKPKLPPSVLHDDELELISRSVTRCTIGAGRVRFLGLSYFAPSLATMTWHRTKNRKTSVKVYYNEADLSHVFIQDPDDPSTEYRADAINPTYQLGLTMYEHLTIRNRIRKERKSGEAQFYIVYRRFLLELADKNRKNAARQRELMAEKRNGRAPSVPVPISHPHYPPPAAIRTRSPSTAPVNIQEVTIPSSAPTDATQRPMFSNDEWS